MPIFRNWGTNSPGSPPVGASPEASPYYPDHIAHPHTTLDQASATSDPADLPAPEILKEQLSFDLLCPGWAAVWECDQYHRGAKAIHCNREWCKGECGGENGPAHERRKASWIPKARQIGSMGRFVLTIPPECRGWIWAAPKEELGRLGIAAKRMMQRHGFARGLRRWHYFGELKEARKQGRDYPQFHPHLEVIVDGEWLSKEKLAAIKASWCRILEVAYDRRNVYYQYIPAWNVKRKLHRIGYALRPTFLEWGWDPDLAEGLSGFRNANSWGKWEDDPVWDIPAGEKVPSSAVVALEAGQCPECGRPVQWLGIMEMKGGALGTEWRELGEGYYAYLDPGGGG